MSDIQEFLIVGGIAAVMCGIGAGSGAKASLSSFLVFVISVVIGLAIVYDMITYTNSKHRSENQPQIARGWR